MGLEWPESDKSILTITLRGQEFNGNRALEVAQQDNSECVELAAPSCLEKAKSVPPSPRRSLHPLGESSSQFSSSQSHNRCRHSRAERARIRCLRPSSVLPALGSMAGSSWECCGGAAFQSSHKDLMGPWTWSPSLRLSFASPRKSLREHSNIIRAHGGERAGASHGAFPHNPGAPPQSQGSDLKAQSSHPASFSPSQREFLEEFWGSSSLLPTRVLLRGSSPSC